MRVLHSQVDPKSLWGIITGTLITTVCLVTLTFSYVEAQSAPPIPHKVAGQEQCLSCHNASGLKPVPANHATFDDKTCLSCHSTSTTAVSEEGCLTCHGQPNFSIILPSGETQSLYVNADEFANSIHGGKLLCADCHDSYTSFPHPKLDVQSIREFSLAQYEVCKKCHFDNYTKTLDSVHYQVLASGNKNAPICTDCHGAHNVPALATPRAKISQTCATCHQALYQAYASSVHGKALIQDNNFDVPVCTDCHPSHTIEDPRTASFRMESVQLCSNCHGDAKIMDKYGISTQVVKTYLQDFHGASVALEEQGNKDIWVKEAVCTDCHGVHDIQVVDSPNSPLIKDNLVQVCRKCHPDATANFPSAWLSHYEPTLQKAPAVFIIRRFYWILIPFIVLGLGIHILIDLWRTITNR